jgi:hypothetical protein
VSLLAPEAASGGLRSARSSVIRGRIGRMEFKPPEIAPLPNDTVRG